MRQAPPRSTLAPAAVSGFNAMVGGGVLVCFNLGMDQNLYYPYGEEWGFGNLAFWNMLKSWDGSQNQRIPWDDHELISGVFSNPKDVDQF